MADSTRVVDWTTVEANEVFPGIVRQALTTDTSTIVRYTYHTGSVFPIHQHPEDQVTLVHSGEIEFTVGGETVVLRAGQIAIIPGDTPHGARVIKRETVVADNFIASGNRTPLRFDRSNA